ncbi:MAG: CoA-binding protein [Polaromonas sp.]|nr:CoA-binding protein [Polaromonas sp.]
MNFTKPEIAEVVGERLLRESPRNLDGLINPQSIAVVGASDRPGSLSGRMLRNLACSGFKGKTYLVNPARESINGVKCYPSVEDLPEIPDVGVLTIPGPAVEAEIRRFGKVGLRNAVVYGAGFREAGGTGLELEDRLVHAANEFGINLSGPNTLGATNFSKGSTTSFSTILEGVDWTPGNIAFVGQSGSLPSIVYVLAQRSGLRASHIIGTGNESVVDMVDYLAYLLDDPCTEHVCAYVEQIARGREMIEICRQYKAAGKSLVLLFGGRTMRGNQAAAFHTGAMKSNSFISRSLLRDAGAVVVFSPEEAVAALGMLSNRRLSEWRPRAAIIAGSGGTAVSTADLAVDAGVSIPVLSDALQNRFKPKLSPLAVLKNPIDIMPSGFDNPQVVGDLVDTLISSGQVDFVIVVGAYDEPASVQMASTLVALPVAPNDAPVVTWFASGQKVEAEFSKSNLPFVAVPRVCFAAIKAILEAQGYMSGAKSVDPESEPRDVACLRSGLVFDFDLNASYGKFVTVGIAGALASDEHLHRVCLLPKASPDLADAVRCIPRIGRLLSNKQVDKCVALIQQFSTSSERREIFLAINGESIIPLGDIR